MDPLMRTLQHEIYQLTDRSITADVYKSFLARAFTCYITQEEVIEDDEYTLQAAKTRTMLFRLMDVLDNISRKEKVANERRAGGFMV